MNFKICRCCGEKTFKMRKQKCNRCGVPAIWDAATKEQLEVYQAEIDHSNKLLNDLMENISTGEK